MRPHGSRMAHVVAMAALGVVLLGPVAATAQEPGAAAGDSIELTLDEAFNRALVSNPAYRQTENDLELNDIERRQTWLSILPQPSLTFLSTSMSWQRQTVVEDLFGNPLPNPETEMVQTSRSNQGASLNFNFDFGSLLDLRDQETQAELRFANLDQQQQELRADITQAFFDAQEQASTRELEHDLLDNAIRNRDAAQRLYRLARRDRTDLVAAELDVAEQENAVEEARFGYENALLSLRNLIGDPELRNFGLVEEPVQLFDPSFLDAEALVDRARTESAQVVQQQASIESARRDLTRGRADWLPTLNVNMSTGRQEFIRESGDAFFKVAPDSDWSRNLGFSLSFPDLGQYFNRRATARSRQITLENSQEQLRQIRMELDQNVRTLVVDLRSAFRSVELQDRRVDLAEEQLELQLESYRLGQLDFLDLQSASESLAQARRQALQARFSFERARISLERALGSALTVPDDAWVDEDVGAEPDGEG